METIGIFTPTDLEVFIEISQLVTLHYFAYAQDFLFSGERHDFWEIAYVDRGEVGAMADGDGYDLRQGEAIFHRPGEYHNIWAKGSFANVVILTFVCNSPAMDFFRGKIIPFGDEERALLAAILDAGKVCFAGPRNDVYETRMPENAHVPFAARQVLKNYIELLLIHLVQQGTDFSRQHRLSQSTKYHGDTHIVEALRRFLTDNVYAGLSFDDVLRQMCFSKSFLTKLFRERTGKAVMGYYLDLRIAEAQRLISRRELTFTEIADRLHFGSIHYFSRVFRSKTGMSPSEYARSVQSLAVL